jgi:hypothetical protein
MRLRITLHIYNYDTLTSEEPINIEIGQDDDEDCQPPPRAETGAREMDGLRRLAWELWLIPMCNRLDRAQCFGVVPGCPFFDGDVCPYEKA